MTSISVKRVVTILGEEYRRDLLDYERQEHRCLVAENRGKVCGTLTDRDSALKVTGKTKTHYDDV